MLRQAVHTRRGRPIFVIDTAVPRDVEPSASRVEGVFLYNIDDLQTVVETSLAVRHAEVERGEAQDFQAVEAALRGTVNKQLHPPMMHLRAAANGNSHQEAEAIRTLCGLDEAAEICLPMRSGDRSSRCPSAVTLRQVRRQALKINRIYPEEPEENHDHQRV
jgi:glutamyl-tRNA reductase